MQKAAKIEHPEGGEIRAAQLARAGLKFPGGPGGSRRIPLGRSIPLAWQSPANGSEESLVCDVTTPDIAASGVIVCKEFIVRSGEEWVLPAKPSGAPAANDCRPTQA